MNAIERPEIFIRDTLAAASALGCTVHQENEPAWRKTLANGADASARCRFTLILPDTRLVSCARYEEKPAALLALCRAAAPYLDKMKAQNAAALK